VDFLESRHGHKIENCAQAGSTLNEIIYNPVGVAKGRLARLDLAIRKLRPQALIFSAGGNDIAGPEFFSFLNHKDSGLEDPDLDVLKGVVDETLETAYETMVLTMQDLASHLGIPLPIFVHGYDYPFPDGRAVHVGPFKSGPWFHPEFCKKGFPKDLETVQWGPRRQILKVFIDEFYLMLGRVRARHPGVVHVVDFRNILVTKNDWGNEMHPTDSGFERLSDKLDQELFNVLH
jgi:lysophospholipase L1-like esterase